MLSIKPSVFFNYGTALLIELLANNTFAAQTIRVDKPSTTAGTTSYASYAHISADGRYVAYYSSGNIFIYDHLTGKTKQATLSPTGAPANGDTIGYNFTLSANGCCVVFKSSASNLIANDTNTSGHLYLHNHLTHTTEHVSDVSALYASIIISADARYIALVPMTSAFDHHGLHQFDLMVGNLYIYDRNNHKTTQISVPGTQQYYSTPAFSADGRYIVFSSDTYGVANPPIDAESYLRTDTFVYDQLTQTFEKIPSPLVGGSLSANSISADGRYVEVAAYPDRYTAAKYYVYDRLKKTTEYLRESAGEAYVAIGINTDGRYTLLYDNNEIYLHNFITHKNDLLNTASIKTQKINGHYNSSFMSADSRYAVLSNNGAIFMQDRLLDTRHRADLKIASTQNPATLKPNSQGSYFFTIRNNGPSAVGDVSLLHLISGGTAISVKPSQGACNFSTVKTLCHLGELGTGQKITLRVVVKAQDKDFNQQLTISGAPTDSVLNNNRLSILTAVK